MVFQFTAKSAALPYLTLLLALNRCSAQDVVVNDDETWNEFFRDMRSTPQFPFPGTLNFFDWDQYAYGFQPSLWDTKDFSSIIIMKPSYPNFLPDYGSDAFFWNHFWRYFEVHLYNEVFILKPYNNSHPIEWKNIDAMKAWDVYIRLMAELYCCDEDSTLNSDIVLGTFGFGCRTRNRKTKCCTAGNWMKLCKNPGLSVVKQWSESSIQVLKFKFYVWLCIFYAPRLRAGRPTSQVREIQAMCPDPCANQPCDEMPNALHGSCLPREGALGVYRNEYTCSCRPNFAFDIYTKQCVQRQLCGTNPCNASGTVRCVDLDQGYRCDCRPENTGSTCSAARNPCLMARENSGEVSGDIACNTAEGNRCHPYKSQRNIFTCECVPPYTRETRIDVLESKFPGSTLPPDNCQAKQDTCKNIDCNSTGNGICMPSEDYTNSTCVCTKDAQGYPLYDGEFCEIRVSQWQEWSVWTLCRPECGDSCFQLRQRFCQHTDGHFYCRGTDEELRSCEPACQPCPNRSFAHLSGVFIKETGTPLMLALASLFMIQTAFMAALKWVMSRDALDL